MNNTPRSEDVFFRAYKNHDRSFEGIFFLAVKTTGIFCRPGCTAKMPKRENVEFFSSSDQAMERGYRPCKRCNPLNPVGEIPPWAQQALQLLDTQHERISDAQLKQLQIDPTRLRRWFNQHFGMTFQSYQRQLKLNRAYEHIRQGDSVLQSALDSGFNSLSTFNEAFHKLNGFEPSNSKQRKVIAVSRLLTPVGPMIAAASDEGLCLLEFHDRKALKKQIQRVQKNQQARLAPGEHELFAILQQQLDEYFRQQRRQFEIPLNLKGSEFQRQVWAALRSIPYGESLSYQLEAEKIGRPNAVRAVATANASNPLAIVVPCHRVIAKSGNLSGYAGGIWRKQFLLKLESTAR